MSERNEGIANMSISQFANAARILGRRNVRPETVDEICSLYREESRRFGEWMEKMFRHLLERTRPVS